MKDNLSNRVATGLEILVNQGGPYLLAVGPAGVVFGEWNKKRSESTIQKWAADSVDRVYQDCMFFNHPEPLCNTLRDGAAASIEIQKTALIQKSQDENNLPEGISIGIALAAVALKLSLGRLQRFILTHSH